MYDEFPFWSAPFGIKLLDMINYRRGITALDIGFGTGFPLVELAMRLGPTCTVRGIDPSTDVIPLVEKKIAVFPHLIGAGRKNSLYISAISIWKVAMLEAKQRITFSVDITSWINDAVSAPGLQVITLRPEISIDSTHLPDEFHGDPADRIIVATARFLGCPLITSDKKILAYSEKGFLTATSL